ncbi:MAG: TonB-dependent receptor [Gallionella sp.]
MKQKIYAVALFGAISFSIAAQAEAVMELVIVTPTRMLQSLDKTIADTTVLDEQEIRKSGAPDVPTLLRSLMGVEVYQNGGSGKQSSTFMRGSNSSHTLVLLDGVRINSATAGTTQIDQLMLDQIERIEVVRGNASSLYGSEAIGGVIQIFTKRGKGAPAFSVSAGAGTQNTRRVAAGFGGEAGDTAFNVQVSKYKTDGVSAVSSSLVPSVNPDKDGYDNTSVSASVRHAIGDAHSLSVSLFDSDATNHTDNSFGLSTDINSSKSHIQKVAVVSENRFSEDWQSKVQISQGVDDIQNYLNGVPDAALGAQFKTASDLLSWQSKLLLGDDDVLLVGLEKLKQQVASSTFYSRTSRADDSLFAGYIGNYSTQQVQINLRRDKYSDFGTAKTWLLGYGFDVTEAWRITASMATAFKAPTLNDLFYPFINYGFGFSYVGNPNLKPERSRDSEFGLHYSNDDQRLDMVYFDNRIHDLIVINTLPAATMINLDEARSDGVELAYTGQFGDTRVRLAATRQNPRDARTGQTLLRRARNFSSVGVTQQLGALRVGGEWQHSGVRTDIDINTFARTTLSAYDVVSFTANYTLDKNLQLLARVDNLFNKDYMLAHGYNPLARALFVGLDYQP